MTTATEQLASQLQERFTDALSTVRIERRQVTVELPAARLLEVCRALRDEAAFHFEQLMDVCGVDYLHYGQADWETEETTSTGFSRGVSIGVYQESTDKPQRFAVVYHLLSLKHNRRLRLRCYTEGNPPRIDSVVDVWNSANWFEREAFDLFGILFDGHPDLRRILTDYGFVGHPFRKDFPLHGNVEVRYDPDKGRVIYQPVTIENRVLVPKVIRHDNRYMIGEPQVEDPRVNA
ncbi:NADH-quinone oxidoreductase subunit C [Methylohalomonas lacus]|uniref:NADH-quinone oxidoreductase subunit C n=1 Tax=Methylohalomonas lacus TaxID=398773 RepID=A0AAE3L3W8_9GAMM|nr:NADH-quinone oxidoreductase subunit C [Methylohalomonas lacus]MCS3902903.1 NADH-quinone oxidoreductase subunit C [Methylohalomonas lacus]